ncbi:MAG: hypothetical protein IPI55_04365 [Flavobacteriales bacterium]|nr:hypothetical protein [Flavobacteriales bacterium]
MTDFLIRQAIKLKTNEIGYMTYFSRIGFDTGFRVAAKAITRRYATTEPCH